MVISFFTCLQTDRAYGGHAYNCSEPAVALSWGAGCIATAAPKPQRSGRDPVGTREEKDCRTGRSNGTQVQHDHFPEKVSAD